MILELELLLIPIISNNSGTTNDNGYQQLIILNYQQQLRNRN
jgi:hypothetical protein